MRRTRLRLAASLVAVALSPLAGSRSPAAPPANWPDQQLSSAIVPVDLEAGARLQRAWTLAASGSFDHACDLIQEVLEGEGASRAVVSEDGRLYVPLRDRAHRIVGEMPPEGLALYRSRVDALARRLLQEAADEEDATKLRKVADLYLCSTSGDDALDRLGNLYLDRGELLRARRAWRRLLKECPADDEPDRAIARVKLAAVSVLLGNVAEARHHLTLVRREAKGGSIRLGGREVALREISVKDLPRAPSVSREPSPLRKRRPPRLRLVWRSDLREVVPSPGQASSLAARAGNGRFLALPTARVVHRNGVLYTKDYNRLVCLQAGAPRRVRWRTEVGNPGRPPSLPANRGNQGYQSHFHAAWVDVGAQSVEVGEGLVLVTEQNRLVVNAREAKDPPNRLAAYDADTGKLRWQSDEATELEKPYFPIVPTIRDGRAYAPVVLGGRFHVAAIRLRDGRLEWAAEVGGTSLRGYFRGFRSDASRLIVDHDSIYVVTNSGLVARLDRGDGRIRWIVRTPSTHTDAGQRAGVAPHEAFAPSDPILVDGRLVVAPSDSSYVLCLDAESGEDLWQARVSAETTHLVGVSNDRVVLGGAVVLCFSLQSRSASGKLLWQRRVPAPSGRGCLVGDDLYVPSGSKVLRFGLARPESEGTEVAKVRGRLGNLVPMPRGLAVATPEGVAILADTRARLSFLAQQIDERPRDPALRLERVLVALAEEGEEETTALRDLDAARTALTTLGPEADDLREEHRTLAFEVHLQRVRRGDPKAHEAAEGLVRSPSEVVRLVLARADGLATAGDPGGAAAVLLRALPVPHDVIVEEDGVTKSADYEVRRRLLALRQRPEARSRCDAEARAARVEGLDLAYRYPAATRAPGALLAAAESQLEENPRAAYDAALRLRRDYPSTREARAARGVMDRALHRRGLAPPSPPEPTVSLPRPLEFRAEQKGGSIRLIHATGDSSGRDILGILRRNDGSEFIQGISAESAKPRWEVAAPRPEQARRSRNRQMLRPAKGAWVEGRLILALPGIFSWFEPEDDSGKLRLVASREIPSTLQRQARQGMRIVMVRRNNGWSPTYMPQGPGRAYLLARGVAIVAGVRGSAAYRLVDRDEGPQVEEIWARTDPTGLIGTPVVVGDRLVVTRPSGVSVRRLDGGEAYRVDLIRHAAVDGARPGPGGDLFVATVAGRLHRCDLTTGHVRWSARLDRGVRRILHVDEERVVLLTAEGSLLSLAAADGSRHWEGHTPKGPEAVLASIAAGNRLVVWVAENPQTTMYGGRDPMAIVYFQKSRLHAFDLGSGERLWSQDLPVGNFQIPGELRLTKEHVIVPLADVNRHLRILPVRLDDGTVGPKIERNIRASGPAGWWIPDLALTRTRLVLGTPTGLYLYGPPAD